MVTRTFGLARFCALLAAATLMAGTSVRAGENEDWCFADQEKTHGGSARGLHGADRRRKTEQGQACHRLHEPVFGSHATQRKRSGDRRLHAIHRHRPGNAVAYAQRGEAYCQKGDIKNCVADFDEAMRIDPNDPSFVYLRGVARADAGDADGGIADLTKAIEQDPGTAAAYVRRGRIYEAEGDKARAAADYRSALKIDPYDETAKQHLEGFSK